MQNTWSLTLSQGGPISLKIPVSVVRFHLSFAIIDPEIFKQLLATHIDGEAHLLSDFLPIDLPLKPFQILGDQLASLLLVPNEFCHYCSNKNSS